MGIKIVLSYETNILVYTKDFESEVDNAFKEWMKLILLILPVNLLKIVLRNLHLKYILANNWMLRHLIFGINHFNKITDGEGLS